MSKQFQKLLRIFILLLLLIIATGLLLIPSYAPKLLATFLKDLGASQVEIGKIFLLPGGIKIEHANSNWSTSAGGSTEINLTNLELFVSFFSLRQKQFSLANIDNAQVQIRTPLSDTSGSVYSIAETLSKFFIPVASLVLREMNLIWIPPLPYKSVELQAGIRYQVDQIYLKQGSNLFYDSIPALELESDLVLNKLSAHNYQINPVNIKFSSLDLAAFQIQQTEIRTSSIEINSDGISGQLKFNGGLKQLKYEKLAASPFFGEASFSTSPQATAFKAVATIDIPKLQLALPFSNIKAKFEINSLSNTQDLKKISVNNLELNILDGQIKCIPATLLLNDREKSLAFDILGVNLKTLLEAYPGTNLSGTGLLDGEFQIRILSSGAYSGSGVLHARQPGGILKGDLSKWAAAYPDNHQIKTVADALKNFEYSSLQTELEYKETGTLILRLTIKGKNPESSQRQIVNLNVVIEEDLPALLQTMQLIGAEH